MYARCVLGTGPSLHTHEIPRHTFMSDLDIPVPFMARLIFIRHAFDAVFSRLRVQVVMMADIVFQLKSFLE